MIPKEDCIKAVKKFRAKQGVEAPDENIIATSESKGLTVDVSKKSMESFFKTLETELAIDSQDGPVPFGVRAINWKQYEE
ncbi:MAG: hypothetical protein WBN75_18175 [Verrucomicrobiia bacterium]|jgi:hypothetical protein